MIRGSRTGSAIRHEHVERVWRAILGMEIRRVMRALLLDRGSKVVRMNRWACLNSGS